MTMIIKISRGHCWDEGWIHWPAWAAEESLNHPGRSFWTHALMLIAPKILHLNVVVRHRLLILLHLLPLVDQHLLHELLPSLLTLSWLTWVSGCILFSLVKMDNFKSITEVELLTRKSHSSPIMVLTVTVMNILVAAPPMQSRLFKSSVIFWMDLLLFWW